MNFFQTYDSFYRFLKAQHLPGYVLHQQIPYYQFLQSHLRLMEPKIDHILSDHHLLLVLNRLVFQIEQNFEQIALKLHLYDRGYKICCEIGLK